jgi:surface polysaccharide O-acyltransferase-like enzyme
MPMLSEEASLRLKILRFPLIVGVVFIHNYDLTSRMHGGAIGLAHAGETFDFVRNIISQGVARVSVPLLFLIAGYLFFMDFQPTLNSLLAKLKSRSRTLLLPFIFWNVATLAIIALAQSLPAASKYLSGRTAPISSLDGATLLDEIFGVHGMPISYQFWFIRDLMVLVLLAPLIYVLCRRLGIPILLALLALWMADAWPLSVPTLDATFFFMVGAWLALKKLDPFFTDRIGPVAMMLYIPALLLDAAWFGSAGDDLIHKASILLGVASVLWITRFAIRSDDIKNHLVRLSGASFFVFAAHEPFLTICRKILFKLVAPHSSYVALGFYFLIPIFVIFVLASLHPKMKVRFPRFTALSCGGR